MKKLSIGFIMFIITGLTVSCAFVGEIWEPADVLEILRKEGDKIPFKITIDSPTNGQEVGATYPVTGTVSGAERGIKTVFARTDGENWTIAECNGDTWTAILHAPAYGAHTNFVYAEDMAGNKTATRQVRVERTAIPSVIVVSPANGVYTNGANITVSGVAVVDAPFTVAKVQVQLNGGGWTDATGTTVWSEELTLVEGTNTIAARAIADNGKTNTGGGWKILYEKVVYVSLTGDDNDSGVRTAPLRSIQAAIDKARALGFPAIRVTEGSYVPGAGLNGSVSGAVITNMTGLIIAGGYDAGFSARTGFSVLDGSNAVYHVVWMENATNILFDGFTVTRGLADELGDDHDKGGGLFIRSCGTVEIAGCLITDNSTCVLGVGGGIYIAGGTNCTVGGTVSGNTATKGGGIGISGGSGHRLSGTISGNTGPSLGYIDRGGGVYIEGGSGHTLTGTVSGNAAIRGGGVYIFGGNGHILNGTISGNTAYPMFDGGGVYIEGGTGHIIGGIISGNTASGYGGGVYFEDSSSNSTHTFQNTVIQNNTNYGVYRENANSDPQGLTTVTTNGNTPTFKNW